MAPFIQEPNDRDPHQVLPTPPTTHATDNSHGDSQQPLITIDDWRDAQISDNGLHRILSLVDSEQKANTETRAWISLASPHQIKAQWSQLDAQRHRAHELPLFGVPFAVKDNIDVEGFPTTAACPAYATKPAATDSTVVARLRAAGAIPIGKTNLDQFATGLVGTRSPHGAVPNSFDPARVSGGSSSGSGVVVGRGTVPFSLGTDTAGSGRVPAGLNNVVGLKPTRGALSTHGVLPACRTLDCVSIFALTVRDAQTVLSIAEGYDAKDSFSRSRRVEAFPTPQADFGTAAQGKRPPSLAICSRPNWFGRDDQFPAYEAALEKARALGWKLQAVDFSGLFDLAKLLYEGPWVAERYAAIREFIEQSAEDDMDPVVRSIVCKAKNFTAADAFASEYLRQDLARQIATAFREFDGILVPTTPTFPTLEQLIAEPVQENSLLGTYTNFVNFLDWSAISIPAGFRADGLPFGITLISNTWQESRLFNLSQQWFSGETRRLGATSACREADSSATVEDESGWTSIAVVGAHLRGFPLNKDLVSRGAQFETSTTTSKMYRLFALSSTSGPKKPGLERVASSQEGRQIAVEVWKLPQHALASFMETIPSPLAIGSLELADGRWVRGFVCEPLGLRNATEISDFGGWKAYMQHLQTHSQCNGVCTQNPKVRCKDKKGVSRVLIANRGEIASRIIRSLHKMNLEAVSIYSDADAGAPHVRDADISLRLEGDSVAETYLDGSQVLKLANSVQADAIIPGYGFLSENADFAQAVEAAGLAWVGPTPDQMSDLGLKHRAREIAESSGVQVVPGSCRLLTSLEDARQEAEQIGFPLMLKSTAGGGGIGLRRCHDLASLDDAFTAVQRLAAANFGDSGVFLERFVEKARHVEVQILGDGKGRVIAAGERDCSLQRRHQKVVEESPAFAVPEAIRAKMRASAVRLASAVKYRNVGTVEFIYDVDTQEYYFLEVNTRLQVEHPVTESVTGLDLVECMLKIAKDDSSELFSLDSDGIAASGASIEVRLYAESPLQSFRPCAGTITSLVFPSSLRVDTWIEEGTDVSTRYDPLLAKLIATGRDRREAVQRLAAGLAETRINGVQTNLEYLRQVVSWSLFESGEYTTKSLDSFQFCSPSLEVLESGAMTTIQDFPGRVGYWNVGIPPSGPMDHLSFRLANRLVNNSPDAAAIECTFQGPTFRVHCDTLVAITGAQAQVTLDDQPVACNQAFLLGAGQTLCVGSVENGYRVYVAIAGGIAVPKVMGSRATFEVGSLGGKDGGKLHKGDLLPIGTNQASKSRVDAFPVAPLVPIPTQPSACWTVGVIPGPHGAPDYFTEDGLASLFAGEWRVHHNSNRLGVRLTGPRPQWARQTGGEAGLHPSNIHDSPYSIGSVSFTGDEAVVLTCDGPSLGGFVVFCVVASSEMWKLGQARPGDTIRLRAIDAEAASRLDSDLSAAIQDLTELPRLEDYCIEDGESIQTSAVAGEIDCGGERIIARQAGDCSMILEFGKTEAFDLRQSFNIHAFCQNHKNTPIEGVEEVTPGVRTIHLIYNGGLSPRTVLDRLANHVSSYTVSNRVPSRTLHLPLAFDDSVSQAAVDRYAATIRSEAPWLPSNVEFLEKLNGLSDVSSLLYDATFLVLGLGDVFLGSPCAVPLDPRHRLFGTKYNPSRSFTPRRSVGIGGQYMCIYATDSPGGYQLVGRTVDIWDSKAVPSGDEQSMATRSSNAGANGGSTDPWLFRPFDRISFYAATELELDAKPASELIHITDGELDLEEYEAWIDSQHEDIAAVAAHRELSISNAPFLDELRRPYQPKPSSDTATNGFAKSALSIGGEKIKAMMPGRCYNFAVKEQGVVQKGDVLVREIS